MDATTIDSRIAALRADDGVIERNLAELDARLSTWLAAMREGQAALLSRVGDIAAAPETDPAPEHGPAAADDQEQSVVPQRGSRLFRRRKGDTCNSGAGGPEAGHQSGKTGPAPLSPETVPASSEVAAPQADEDEVLLSSLDPETANAIRVKRRLTSNKKTVRELLDETRAGQTGGKEADPRRRRWWRRDDG